MDYKTLVTFESTIRATELTVDICENCRDLRTDIRKLVDILTVTDSSMSTKILEEYSEHLYNLHLLLDTVEKQLIMKKQELFKKEKGD